MSLFSWLKARPAATTESKRNRTQLRLQALEDRSVPATITIDYSRDLAGFFNDPNRRAVLQQALDEIGARLGDNLAAITPGGMNNWSANIFDPATGDNLELGALTIAQNEIRVYVGGRDLPQGGEAGLGGTGGASGVTGSQAFVNAVINRGQGETQGPNASEFAAWGGSITFDNQMNWYFGTDPKNIAPNQLDFYSIAQHEFGHVLGFGTSDSWNNRIVGNSFSGTNSVQAFGGMVPLFFDRAHWAQSVTFGGQQAAMTPSFALGDIVRFTALDYAALDDIGWTLTAAPPPNNGGGGGGGGTTPDVNKLFATGTEAGNAPHVKVFNPDGSLRFSFFAYDINFRSGVRVATGDVTGDGVDDIITAAGAGGGPHVQVFDGTNGALIRSFFAYSANFTSGVFVSTADVNGDGRADIITGAGAGGGPHVLVFDAVTNNVIQSFFAYGANYTGGVNVAGGDVNGDGRGDIVTGTGAGSASHVRVFSGIDLRELASYFAYAPNFLGGVFVAVGDVNGDGRADVITTPGSGGGPQLQVFSGANNQQIASFFAGSPTLSSGIRVASNDLNEDGLAEILVSTGPGTSPTLSIYQGGSLNLTQQFLAYDPNFLGGFFVG